jgi:hypothetical protein
MFANPADYLTNCQSCGYLENPPKSGGGIYLGDKIWEHGADDKLSRAFAWLTRTGAGRRFPGMPIGWYQAHQVAALDALHEHARRFATGSPPEYFRLHLGGFQLQQFQFFNEGTKHWEWMELTPRMLFEIADRRVRNPPHLRFGGT